MGYTYLHITNVPTDTDTHEITCCPYLSTQGETLAQLLARTRDDSTDAYISSPSSASASTSSFSSSSSSSPSPSSYPAPVRSRQYECLPDGALVDTYRGLHMSSVLAVPVVEIRSGRVVGVIGAF